MEKASCWGWMYLSSVGMGKGSHLVDWAKLCPALPSSVAYLSQWPQIPFPHQSCVGCECRVCWCWWPQHTPGWEGVSHARGQAQKMPGECGLGTDLGLYVVGNVVGCAAQWDLPDRPWSIIGQVGGQDADPQLTLGVQWAAKSGVNKARANEPRPPQMFSSSGDGISGLLCWVVTWRG